mgnify:CR=1 FL=1
MSRQAHGLRAWLLQRFTAAYIALYILIVGIWFLWQPLHSYAQWRAWLAAPLANLATALFIVTLLIHAWVGVRDMIMDYVRHTGLRVSLMALVAVVLGGCGLWSLRVVFVVVA